MKRRIAITGNSGSGKSYLARQLASNLDVRVVDLDEIFWLPGQYNSKRPTEELDRLVAQVRSERAWVVEGVFGDLLVQFLDLADDLIWLDLPWTVCQESLLQRQAERSRQDPSPEAEDSFQKLLTWSSQYWTRIDLRSHDGHERLYEDFSRDKRRFTKRSQVDEFMRSADGSRAQAPELMA